MLYLKKIKSIQAILLLLFFSLSASASTYHYRANVKGMVCAFCVYSVEKNIRSLAGIDAESVKVSLKNNVITFSAQQKISNQELSALFKDSGFSISRLSINKKPVSNSQASKQARLDLSIDVFETDQFTSLLKTIGDIAIKKPSRIHIEAPQEQEDIILKALLMGRDKPIQVLFISNESADKIRLQLYDTSSY